MEIKLCQPQTSVDGSMVDMNVFGKFMNTSFLHFFIFSITSKCE